MVLCFWNAYFAFLEFFTGRESDGSDAQLPGGWLLISSIFLNEGSRIQALIPRFRGWFPEELLVSSIFLNEGCQNSRRVPICSLES
jgi:hypothetical protein